MTKPRARDASDDPPLSMRMQGALHLYKAGFRITSDGRLSRPRHGIERIAGYGSRDTGPSTSVMLPRPSGMAKEVVVPYYLLAALSFYGPYIFKPGVRVLARDGDRSNLKKANIYVDERKQNLKEQALSWKPKLNKRQRTWEMKHREDAARELRERYPALFDKDKCAALALLIDNKRTTIEQAAQRLGINLALATIMLERGRAVNSKSR